MSPVVCNGASLLALLTAPVSSRQTVLFFARILFQACITAFITAKLAGKTVRTIILFNLIVVFVRNKNLSFKAGYCVISHGQLIKSFLIF